MRKYLIEFFSNINILVSSILFLIGVAISVPNLGDTRIWLSFFVGIALYALSEYTIHRYVFHMKPSKKPLIYKLVKRLHYDHHQHADDLKLLFLPIWCTIPVIFLASVGYFYISGNKAMSISFFSGVFGFLLYYEWSHYVAHRPIKPITPWGKRMKKLHALHHYKNENYWYGVTSPTFDILMGTYKEEKQMGKSKNIHTPPY